MSEPTVVCMIACGQCLFSISQILTVVCTCAYPITYIANKVLRKKYE
jgi:hypothetical protein